MDNLAAPEFHGFLSDSLANTSKFVQAPCLVSTHSSEPYQSPWSLKITAAYLPASFFQRRSSCQGGNLLSGSSILLDIVASISVISAATYTLLHRCHFFSSTLDAFYYTPWPTSSAPISAFPNAQPPCLPHDNWPESYCSGDCFTGDWSGSFFNNSCSCHSISMASNSITCI